MKSAQVSHQLGHAGPSLFASSLVASLFVHGLVMAWMLSGSGSVPALPTDLPAFHSVSLVDAPGSTPPTEPVAKVSETEPRAIPDAVAVPEAPDLATVRKAVPETVVQPPQAKPAKEVAGISVEPPVPVSRPKPVEVPERPPVITTQVQQPEPVKPSEKRPVPAPTPTSAGSPVQSPTREVAPQSEAAPEINVADASTEPASRNSPEDAARARAAIENLRSLTDTEGIGVDPRQGGVQLGPQEIRLRTYTQRVRVLIIRALHLPMMQKTAQALEAIALLTIDREGQVIRYELTKSSGNRSFDASVHRAVQASSPLPPLPETYPDEILEAEIYVTPPASS
ncbi:MAG: TonB family protein [Candidatus Tectomicrobia bacterium]|nr:TonB family protein [Candidatus Tectomicrobia bacterium]